MEVVDSIPIGAFFIVGQNILQTAPDNLVGVSKLHRSSWECGENLISCCFGLSTINRTSTHQIAFYSRKNVKFYKIECLFTMALVLYTVNPTKTPSLHHRTAIDDYSRFCSSVICHNYFLHVAFQKLWKLAVFAH